MVKSRLVGSVEYPNVRHIYPEDNKKKTSLYETDLYGIDVMIVIGDVRDDYKHKQVVYFPMYLVKTNNKVVQVGLFEIPEQEYVDVMDTQDLEDRLPEPLLYDFATKEFIQEQAKKVEVVSIDNDEEDNDSVNEISIDVNPVKEIPSYRSDIFTLNPKTIIIPPLTMETEQDARSIREKYHMKSDDIWIKKWMKNKHYSIKDNEGGGDCLFATIRDAFESIGQETSVSQIRKKLAEEVDESIYQNYKEQYDMYSAAIKHTTTESLALKKQVETLQEHLKGVISMEQKRRIALEGKKIKEKYDLLKKENQLSKELLNEFKIMKNIKSFKEFKEKIMTCDFWADDWAIHTLERILRIKFIILSSERYAEGDYGSVLHCANIIDPTIEENKVFEPEFYILIDHTGSHYKLIGYKNKYIFTFSEIPYDIKRIVIDKCLQKEAGIYYLIPDFISFKSGMLGGSSNNTIDIDIEYLNESKLNRLYHDNVILGIDINGSQHIMPGMGRSEKMEPMQEIFHYVELYSQPNWRKTLAREYPCVIELDGHKWNSVEHYYQANKFKNNPEFYLEFSLDSNKESGKDVLLAKALGGIEGKHKGKQIRKTEITIDPDFYGKRQQEVLKKAHRAKFTQHEDLKKQLLSTQRAKLLRLKKASPPEIYDELMVVRNEL